MIEKKRSESFFEKSFSKKYFIREKSSLLIYLMISLSFFVQMPKDVFAQSNTQEACCEKTKSGDYCVYTDKDNCDTSNGLKTNNARCEQSSFCSNICCVSSSDKSCFPNTPSPICSNQNGKSFNDASCSNVPGCVQGCCIIGNQKSFRSENECKILANSVFGSNHNFNDIFKRAGSEIECLNLNLQEQEGCCIDDNVCSFGKRNSCEGQFKLNKKCSQLNECRQKCQARNHKDCYEGSVYWFDSCGNREDLSEQCNYEEGKLCGKENGNIICKDLTCKDTKNYPEWSYTGGPREHGEGWCIYDGPTGNFTDRPGSRHYRLSCLNGEEVLEPCLDMRKEICAQAQDPEGYSYASCIRNNVYDSPVNSNISSVAPGFKFWEQNNKNKDQCNKGSSECTVVWVRKSRTDDWDCKANCFCETQQFIDDANTYCKSFGDCGFSYNIAEQEGSGGFNVYWSEDGRGEKPTTLSTDYKSYLKKYGIYAGMIFLEDKMKEFILEINKKDFDEKTNRELTAKIKLYGYGLAGVVGVAGLELGGFTLLTGALTSAFSGTWVGSAASFVAAKLGVTGTAITSSTTTAGTASGTAGAATTATVASTPAYVTTAAAEAAAATQAAFAAEIAATTGVGSGAAAVEAATAAAEAVAIADAAAAHAAAAAAASGGTAAAEGTATAGGVVAGGATTGPGIIIAIVIAIIILIVTLVISIVTGGGKVRLKTVTLECNPWQAPLGGNNCEKCNEESTMGCTEYKCKSLGTTCELIETNDNEFKCIDSNPNDLISPKITPFVYQNGYTIAKEKLGYKFNQEVEPLKKFTFGFKTNEAASCKFAFNNSIKYDDMEYYFGNSFFKKDHNMSVVLEGSKEFKYYIRCVDITGNYNNADYLIKFKTKDGPDLTPPIILGTSIKNNVVVANNVNQLLLDLELNEPANCRYDRTNTLYENMGNQSLCNDEFSRIPIDYKCIAGFSGLRKGANTYYFRCRDLANNTNQQSYIYNLVRSEQLGINIIEPSSNDIYVSDVTLNVQTSNGAENGKAICKYSLRNEPYEKMIEFKETNSNRHLQSQINLRKGNYNYFVKCMDNAGNVNMTNINFNVVVERKGDEIVNVYKDNSRLYVITDVASDCEYNKEDFILGNGIKMNGDKTTVHSSDIQFNQVHIKCKDDEGKELKNIIVNI